ncbi:MAG: VWA domain-containing protein [Balneolaceae bacterium]|nr:MAG: VWA domain-containing protein [Balneolaceae bacterium]
MTWENSEYLWFLLLLPLLALFHYGYRRYSLRKRAALFDDRLSEILVNNYWETGDKIRLLSLLIAALLFIVALAGPKIGVEVREVERRGLNLMIALDLSRSMNAEDVAPSRIQKAKFEINRLINRLQGDRIGLIVFTDEAFVQVPFTTDYAAFRMLLDITNTDQMPSSGTNFRAAMRKAIESFESVETQSQASNVLLFIADGENHGPDFQSEMNRLIASGVVLFSAGIGTAEGVPIPLYGAGGNLTGYHRDRSGNVVTTRLASDTMRRIANSGGGEYYEIRSGSDTIEPFFSKLDELERGEFSTQEFADYKNQYQLLLLAGLLFFMISLFFPDHLNRAKKINQFKDDQGQQL